MDHVSFTDFLQHRRLSREAFCAEYSSPALLLEPFQASWESTPNAGPSTLKLRRPRARDLAATFFDSAAAPPLLGDGLDPLLNQEAAESDLARLTNWIHAEARLVWLHEPTLLLGRDGECALCFEHSSISRKHARLEREGQDWLLTDLNSSNGTYVQGVALKPQRRRSLGDYPFRLGTGVVARALTASALWELCEIQHAKTDS